MAEVAHDLTERIKNDESMCKIRETYFMMDALDTHSEEEWIILKNRHESQKRIRISIEAIEYESFGIFENCEELANEIESNYHIYDGFVIVQSWDNIDNVSSCLSFMMEDLSKPIVFTGGRIPLEEPGNDLISNFMEACFIAGAFEIPEVCIFCDSKLMRANRTIVFQPDSVNALKSPNFKLLGQKNATLTINWKNIRKKPTGGLLNECKVNRDYDSRIGHCFYVPDLSKSEIDSLFKNENNSAILMEFFGAGNTPEEESYLVKSMKEVIAKGVPVFFTSQCHKGHVSSLYASSAVAYGAIACEDLTVPCAIAKIGFLIKKVSF